MKVSTIKKKLKCDRCGESPSTLVKGTIVRQGKEMKAEFKLSLMCIGCLGLMIRMNESEES